MEDRKTETEKARLLDTGREGGREIDCREKSEKKVQKIN